MRVDEYLSRDDDNYWWTLPCGEHLNLFEDALNRAEAAEAKAALHWSEVERLDGELAAAEEEVARLRRALELARHYVVKGIEHGAYGNTVLSGETALDRIDNALKNSPVE